MLRHGYGLLWAEWKRTRKALILGMTMQVCILAHGIWPHFAFSRFLLEVSPLWSLAVAICLLTVLLVSQHASGELRFAIPRRSYLLPVDTFQIVFWLYLFRLTMVLATSAMAAASGTSSASSAAARPALVMGFVAAYAVIQALVWLAPCIGSRPLSYLFLFVLGTAAVLLYVRYASRIPSATAWRIGFLSLLVTVSYGLSCISLGLLRSGEAMYRGGGSAKTLHGAFDTGGTLSFYSKTQALFWFEWRSNVAKVALFFSVLLLAMDGLLHVGSYFESLGGADAHLERLWISGLFLMVSAAVLARIWIGARRLSQMRRLPGRYLHRQALDDTDLAHGRIMSIACAVSMWTVVFVVGTVAMSALTQWLSSRAILHVFPSYPLWAFIPLATVFTWVAYWQGWLIVALCLGLLPGAWGLQHFAPSVSEYVSLSPERIAIFATMLGAMLAVFSFAGARYRGLLTSRTLCLFALLATGASCLGVTLLRSCQFLEGSKGAELWTLCGALSLLAMSPFATAPLAIHRVRHR
ncbi:MAG: hypothetical protein WC655_03460 [Candidatus Hydrogenedentales bacterium]|jgi:hypothetical protein